MAMNLTFVHPTDNSTVVASCEGEWSAEYTISELIRNGFLKEIENPDKEEYRLVASESKIEFRGDTTLDQAEVGDGQKVIVVIRTKAGLN